MRSIQSGLCLVVVFAISCDLPRLPELADGGSGSNGGSDGGGSGDGGGDRSPLVLELLAGDIGGSGNVDGPSTIARFNDPCGVAVDGAGNLYVTDDSVIRKVTASGDVTTLAGGPMSFQRGSADGTGADARFYLPTGVAVDSVGNLYIADSLNHTIRKITATGVVRTLAGAAGMPGNADGAGSAARFDQPRSTAIDGVGNIYVADSFNHTIRKVTAAGVVTTLAGTASTPGSADGTGTAASFNTPTGVTVDGAGNIYVADQANHTIRKVSTTGVVTTLAGAAGMLGREDGTGNGARFYEPTGVAVDSAGNLYVADQVNESIRKVTPAGVVTTLAGNGGYGWSDGTGNAARFDGPTGVAVDSLGNVYVADSANYTIRKVTATGVVTTFAGAAWRPGSADGTGAAAGFRLPGNVAVDIAGDVYVPDGNSTIRKITATGIVTTFAGSAGMYGTVDGVGGSARFGGPSGAAVDGAGNIYVADLSSSVIRKVTPECVVTTLAGAAGMRGSADGVGAAARFSAPSAVAVDSAGNVYVADLSNDTIRKITSVGVVSTLAGTAGAYGSADGTGPAARFDKPSAVAVDSSGNVYVADVGNSTIRKITATGTVITLAGRAGAIGYADGPGATAQFYQPYGVAVDSHDNVYVADSGNSVIRKITPAAITTTIAGSAGRAGILIGEAPRFGFPVYLAVHGDSIFISDANAILLLRHSAQ